MCTTRIEENAMNETKRILIVEDSATMRAVCLDKLQRAGFLCSGVELATEALALLQKADHSGEPFDAVLLDWILPGMSAPEFLRLIDEEPRYQHLAVMIFSERPDEEAYHLTVTRKRCDLQLKDELDKLPARISSFLSIYTGLGSAQSLEDDRETATGHVLLVDDSATVRARYAQLLSSIGLTVTTADSVAEGLRVAQENPPDLAIIDYYMPDGNGDELCQKMAADAQLNTVPTVMFSARRDARERALASGAIDLIYKDDPVHVFLLRVRAILKAMRVQRLARDLEQAKESAALMREAKELAEAANRAKSEFLANMSHELRSPLNSLLVLSKMLADNREGNLTADQRKSAEIIHDSGQGLLTIINDLLDLAKVEAGHMPINMALSSIDSITTSMDNMFTPIANNGGINFEIQRDQEVPDFLFTDAQRLTQILRNLLSNACKFTLEKGVVRLKISLNTVDRQVTFAVEDDGIGIEANKLELIFESFQQADNSTSRQYGGTGLGLAISREMSHLLGGYIRVTSEAGKGSCFTLSVPLRDEDQQEVAETVSLGSDSSVVTSTEPLVDAENNPLALMRILVVDDDMRNTFAIGNILEHNQFSVVLADNGQTALDKLDQESDIALVLMDIQMPVMNGYEAMEKIRQQARFSDLPIIALTAAAMPEDEKKCLSAGANAYCPKPVEMEVLIEKMRFLLEDRL